MTLAVAAATIPVDVLDPADYAKAILNILEDFVTEQQTLKDTQSAVLNILEDFDIERGRAERAYRDLIREMSGRRVAEDALQRAKTAEEELRRARDAAETARAQLESANKELESFSYSVAHDLRAPLRAIHGFSQILVEDCADRLDSEGKRLLGVVVANVAHMEALIDGLLDFARFGRAGLSFADVDMDELVHRVEAEVRRGEPGRVVDVTIEPLGHAWCDPTMLHQVWTNLLSNAFKFTRDVVPAHVTIRRQQVGDEAVFSVSDDGVGFDMEYAAKLFGVFERLHATSFEGTGIGLAIVRRVLERHGGRVWATSEPGKGAIFSFTLAPGGRQAADH